MKICDACGSPAQGGIGMGGALICSKCAPDVRAEMDKLREVGKPVNVMHIAKRLFREIHGTPGVLQIRDVPTDLRDKMDRRALDEKCSLRELGLKAVYQYLA